MSRQYNSLCTVWDWVLEVMLNAYGLSTSFGKATWPKVLQDSFYPHYLFIWKNQLANVKLKIDDYECLFSPELYFRIGRRVPVFVYSDPIWHIASQTLCLPPHREQDLSHLLFAERSIACSVNYPDFDSSDKIWNSLASSCLSPSPIITFRPWNCFSGTVLGQVNLGYFWSGLGSG